MHPLPPDAVDKQTLVQRRGKQHPRQKTCPERLRQAQRPVAHQTQRAAGNTTIASSGAADMAQDEKGGERACSSGKRNGQDAGADGLGGVSRAVWRGSRLGGGV